MITNIHPSWQETVAKAYNALTREYRTFLETNRGYIPNQETMFNAFKTLPKDKVKYILFGQDPYPRKESAGGYAFIDANVKTLFTQTGLSKEVNRATSLRNFIKMALIARGDLHPLHTSQEAIATVDKTTLINSIDTLRNNFENSGVLLLNTALIFTSKEESKKHTKVWQPFMQTLLSELEGSDIKLILFGNHAKALAKNLPLDAFRNIKLEHPYNVSFVGNPEALKLFKPMDLLFKVE